MGFLGDIGDMLFGGGKTETSQTQTTSGQTRYTLPEAIPMQQFAEDAFLNMLKNYMGGGGTGQLQTATAGPSLTPQQTGLLEGQTKEFMGGLMNTLEQWRKSAMSRAQQSAIKRGIPLSDIARGQEANVDAQMMQQLAQGYTGAKTRELQGKLDYPMQNLQYLLAANQPYMTMLNQLGMSRLAGQRNVDTTGTMTGSSVASQGSPGLFGALGQIGNLGSSLFGQSGMFGSGGAFAPGGTFSNTTASGWQMR